MDIHASLHRAQALYEQRKYAEAATLANSLAAEDDAPFKEIFLMNAKGLIRMAPRCGRCAVSATMCWLGAGAACSESNGGLPAGQGHGKYTLPGPPVVKRPFENRYMPPRRSRCVGDKKLF